MSTVTWKRVSPERFGEAFNMLAAALERSNGFLLGGPQTDRRCSITKIDRAAHTAFIRIGDHCFESVEPVTRPEFRRLIGADVTRNQVQGV